MFGNPDQMAAAIRSVIAAECVEQEFLLTIERAVDGHIDDLHAGQGDRCDAHAVHFDE
jgi:hypothetical protein